MDTKYKSIKHIGEGAFSSVILALNIESGEKVAIKKMKKRRWKDTAAQAEIGALKKLHHDNIIRLLDVFREDYRSFLVFECMDCDLNELVVSRQGRRLPETVILDITYQVLNGLDFIHSNDFFHRDIKPENVLIRRHIMSGGPGSSSTIVVEAKIADFGLVHDMDFSRPLTDYISTRWYRAPEVLLNCSNYSTPIDVWAVGTIISELATLRPLFPGTNQIDQLRRIFEVLGTPRISAPTPGAGGVIDDDEDFNSDSKPDGSWYEGAVHARKLGIAFVPSIRKPLGPVMPGVSSDLTGLVDYILVLNPNARPTAKEALNYVSGLLDNALGEPHAQAEVSSTRGDDMRVPQSKPSSAAALVNNDNGGNDDEDEISINMADVSQSGPKANIGVCSMEIDPPKPPPASIAGHLNALSRDKLEGDTKAKTTNDDLKDNHIVPETQKQTAAQNGQASQKRVQRIPPIVKPESAVKSWDRQQQQQQQAKLSTQPLPSSVSATATVPSDQTGESDSKNPTNRGDVSGSLKLKPASNVKDGRISFTPHDSPLLKKTQQQQQQQNQQQGPGPWTGERNNISLAKIKESPLIQKANVGVASSGSGSASPMLSPPDDASTSRKSAEINIIRGTHKEPIRDPRGDLSDIAVRQPPARTAVAKRIVLPHMRATTPVSASVPAPQIAPRLSNNHMHDRSTNASSGNGAAWLTSDSSHAANGEDAHAGSEKRKPLRLGVGQTNSARVNNLRARSQTVSSVCSAATTATHSIVLSPTSSNMLSESQYSSIFSETGDHVVPSNENKSVVPVSPNDDAKRGLRIYADANRSAIGKSSLMSMLAQQQQVPTGDYASSNVSGGRVASSIANTLANAGAATVPLSGGKKLSSTMSSSDSEHIRKAPGVFNVLPRKESLADKHMAGTTGARPSTDLDVFIPLRTPNTLSPVPTSTSAGIMSPPHEHTAASAKALSSASNGSSPDPANTQHNSAPNGAAPKQQQQGLMRGLRSRNGLGSPLIRRALSMRKKGSKESQQYRDDVYNASNSNSISQLSMAMRNKLLSPPLPQKLLDQTGSMSSKQPKDKAQQQLQQDQQDSSLAESYTMVSKEDSSSQPSHAVKRSKSALAIKLTANGASSRLSADSKDPGSPSLFSLQSSLGQLDLNAEMQAALAEGVSLYGLDGLSGKNTPADNDKKDEWISNIQFLRQRLADNNISVGDVTTRGSIGGKSSVRKRRSSSSDARLANVMLYGDTLSYKSSAIAAADVLGNNIGGGGSVRQDTNAHDYLGMRMAMEHMARNENGGIAVTAAKGGSVAGGVSVHSKPQQQQQQQQQQKQHLNGAKDGSQEEDMIAGLDAFAPVTFDAGTLFKRPPFEAPEGTPDSPYYPDGVRSPLEYMATFSEVRRKYSSSKAMEEAAAAAAAAAAKAGSDHAGGHWFLSKVKSALTGGGRHGSNNGHYSARQQAAGQHGKGRRGTGGNASKDGNSEGGDTTRSNSEGLLPRLDVDLGATSLLTPESLHRAPQEEYTLVSHGTSSFPKLQGGADPAASGTTTAPASSDSTYYLIDYINGNHEDGGNVASSGKQQQQQQQQRSEIRAARRVVNKSTRARQTQYEYNFGSQIFECLDKDLLLLKTDAFKDFEKEVRRRVDLHGEGGAAQSQQQQQQQQQHQQQQQQQQQQQLRRGKGDLETAAKRGRKKPTDVTAATAYTAAAINSIVAHNAKARSTKLSASPSSVAPGVPDTNTNQLSWQLMT
ncbi:hypothetical protein EV177_006407 [Coemansia sp. RSA 1804]|nr:hypothetical protein EV177_006407 [Coemansia sp. RSA 1804]